MRRSDPRRHNKADFSALEFLVECQRFENLLAWKIWRQMRRQLELPQKIDNRIALIARQSSAFYRDFGGRDNSKTDRFAVKKFAIIPGALDRVTHSMSEIEKRALAGAITLVFRHDFRLDFDVAADERRQIFKIDIFKRREHFRIR